MVERTHVCDKIFGHRVWNLGLPGTLSLSLDILFLLGRPKSRNLILLVIELNARLGFLQIATFGM